MSKYDIDYTKVRSDILSKDETKVLCNIHHEITYREIDENQQVNVDGIPRPVIENGEKVIYERGSLAFIYK